MRPAPRVAVLLVVGACALSAPAQETLHFTRAAPIHLAETASRPQIATRARNKQHDEPRPSFASNVRGDTARRGTMPVLAAPMLVRSFASDIAKTIEPADASGAAGPQHVVGMTNEGVTVHSRDGARLMSVTLPQFWYFTEAADVYDPRIVYDARGGRWIAMAIVAKSELAIAVSRTNDPTQTWDRWVLTLPSPDFSRLVLTRDTVMFATHVATGDAFIFSARKSDMYERRAELAAQRYTAPYGSVPVAAPDDDVQYVLDNENDQLRINRLETIDQPWRAIDATIPIHTTSWVSRQKGTTRGLNLGLEWIENAVFRNGRVHAVQSAHAAPFDPSARSGIVWWTFDAESGGDCANGFVVDERSNRGFPSLAVNSASAMLLCYSRMSENEYPSAACTYVDAEGRMSAERTVKDGESPAGTISGRWGDYTETVVDPLNALDFWTVQLYGANGKWSTAFAHVSAPPNPRKRAVRH